MCAMVRSGTGKPPPPKAGAAPAQAASRFQAPDAAKAKPQEHRRSDKVVGAAKIRSKELSPFSRQLSAMLLAGMPIIQSLDALQEQTGDKNFKSVILGLKTALQSGASFSESLQRYPAVFDQLYINMVKAGESGGQLGETVARLAGFLESTARLTRKVKSAMTYPVIVLCLSLAIAIAMITFIVPVFAGMFKDFRAELPAPTQFMVNLSGILRSYGIFMALGIAGIVVAFKKWKQTAAGALAMARFALKFPIIGELVQKIATSRFARTFAQLLKSGVPILRAMEIVSGATGNKLFEKILLESRAIIERGETLSSALAPNPCFPRLLIHMMSAGEKTGKIDEMMQNIADFYDDEVETMLDGLTSLIEPLLMIFLGLIIGSIVISMFLPIFKMGEIVAK
ncbi:MAG: type II secretion system F family protein [Lentisphaerae bacterium]|nr:type II secretion system F family protein [Lentisphaerota bacterium]